MVVFGLITEDNQIIQDFINDTNKRLDNNNLVKNPFVGKVYGFKINETQLLHIVIINPIYFNVTYFGWLYVIGVYFILGLTYWLIPGFILGSMGIFWALCFYRYIYKKGLVKAGYLGYIEHMQKDGIIENIMMNK